MALIFISHMASALTVSENTISHTKRKRKIYLAY